jgi:ubiquinone/menaquinone biosynthesis C-methylase UbiE
MAEIGKFTQPDSSPQFFIEFLDFLDQLDSIRQLRHEVANHLHLAARQKILDLGCGIGGATFSLAEVTGPSGLVAGVDVSTALIEVARERAGNQPGIEFRVGDASAIPYPDGFFDAARSERVFLYLPDRLQTLHEMKRVVRAGGRICIVDTDLDCTAIYSTTPALTRKLTSLVADSMPNPTSARDLPALVRQAGLNEIETATFAISTPYEFMLRVMLGPLQKAVENGMVAKSEVDGWLREQAALNTSGDFFHAWLFVLCSGIV